MQLKLIVFQSTGNHMQACMQIKLKQKILVMSYKSQKLLG